MGKKGLIVSIALLTIVLGVMVWAVLRPREHEPVYKGKPLSYWLGGYFQTSTNDAVDQKMANEAMKHVGTNAIPTLLRMLRKTDSALKLKLLSLSQKQHFFRVPYTHPTIYYSEARDGFRALGPLASNAVPELVKIYDQNLSPMSQATIAGIFGTIGPAAKAAVPSLVRELVNTNGSVRNNAIVALGRIHADPDVVVPALIKALNDSDPNNQVQVAMVLRAYGTDAKAAVPALIELSKQPSAPIPMPGRPGMPRGARMPRAIGPSEGAAMALRQIDPETADRVLTNTSSSYPILHQ